MSRYPKDMDTDLDKKSGRPPPTTSDFQELFCFEVRAVAALGLYRGIAKALIGRELNVKNGRHDDE
jgi:hypothetical protein